MPEGGTSRQALESIEKRLGRPVPELHGNQVPYCLSHLWDFLKDMMISGRSFLNGAPIPLSATEIKAWCVINQITLAPFEVKALRQMDIGYIEGLRS